MNDDPASAFKLPSFQAFSGCHFDTAHKGPGAIGIRWAAEVARVGTDANSRIG